MAKQALDKSVDEKQWDPDSIYYGGRRESDGAVVTDNSKKAFNHDKFISSDSRKERMIKIKQIKESLKLGLEYFKAGNLKQAEKELVKVIKPVLSKSSMKDLYVKTEDVKGEALDAIYHLGLIYLKDASYFNYHAKATGIFQYCAAFAKRYYIGDEEFYLDQAHQVEAGFLKRIDVSINESINSREIIELYKEELEKFRDEVKAKLISIKDLKIDKIGDRANIVEEIYNDCCNFFVNNAKSRNNKLDESQDGLLQRLLSDCYKQLGNPPGGCEHAIIALGSLALGTMTPWSDLEFAILVNKSEYKEYFRNLTKLLQIKVINLGETHLKGLGVEALNNFKTGQEQDEWFWDDVIKIKFNFDSARWDACKMPLGRQGNHRVTEIVRNEKTGIDEKITLIKRDYELICTPDEMAAFQKEITKRRDNEEHKGRSQSKDNKQAVSNSVLDLEMVPAEESVKVAAIAKIRKSWFESDKHLVQALRSVSLIDGSQELLDKYRVKSAQVERPEILQERALEILKENIEQFELKLGDGEEGRLIDSKMNIYRLGDRVINGLSNYYNIIAGEGAPKLTVWQMVEKLQQRDFLSTKGAQHLKEAVAVATELRLNTYSHNDTRSESVSTYVPAVEHLTEGRRRELIEETFHMDKNGIESLYHFYYVMLRVQTIVKMFYNKPSPAFFKILLKRDNLFTNNNYNKGMVHARFLEYDKALKYIETAKDDQPKDLQILNDLFFLYIKTGTIEGAITIAEEMLKLKRNEHQDNLNYLSFASSYNNLGVAYSNKGEYDQAIKYHQQALNIRLKAYRSNPNHLEIADGYNNLGNAYYDKGEYDQAIKHHQHALTIYHQAYRSSPDHLGIASSCHNLGNAYYSKEEYDQAIKHQQYALAIYHQAYKNSPNHPDIAKSYNNLGNIYESKGEYDQAIKHHQYALAIYHQAYKNSPNHPDIAKSYNNLGNAYYSKGEYDQAIENNQRALTIKHQTYKNSQNHCDIANSYHNLGNIYESKGEYDQAIENNKRALKIRLKAYKNSQNHPDIAKSYNSLGNIYESKGKYDKACSHAKKALDIFCQHPNQHHITMVKNLYYRSMLQCQSRAQKIATSLTKEEVKAIQNSGDDALNKANKLNKKQKKQQAAKKYEEALKLFEQISNNEQIAKILQKLQTIYIKLGDQEKQRKIAAITADKARVQFESTENNVTNKAELATEEKTERNVRAEGEHAPCLARKITSFEEIPLKQQGNIRMVSYNVTVNFFDDKDKTSDQHHHWSYRVPFVKTILASIHPDVFCLQELSPDQAIELENYFCKQLGYKAIFLSQTPSEIEPGSIAYNDEVSDWKGKWAGTFLLGTFISRDWKFAEEGVGRFWLNENSDEVPQNIDRGTTDKGFGNMNTYRAVLWAKIENDSKKSLFVFNSHYPINGTSKTRFECAKLEMKKIVEITKGENWISTGDRNIIPVESDDGLYNPETIYRELVRYGHDVREAKKHYGVSTTWIGFTYDNHKTQISGGDFQNDTVLDVMVSNMMPEISFIHPGSIDRDTLQLTGLSSALNEEQNEERYFASDHCLIGGDFWL